MDDKVEVEVDLEAGAVNTVQMQPMPRLITLTITKPTRDSMAGLGVVDKPGFYGKTAPVISSIKEGSLCAGTSLAVGMHLYSINGVPCKGRDDATAMMKVSEGSITIRAGPPGLVWATVVKPTVDTKVGLHMERHKNSQKVVVGSVKGLFAATELKEGMTILQINDQDITGKPMTDVLSMISETDGKVTVLAQAPQDLTTTKLMSHPPPEGLADGVWGTTTYVGPQTGSFAIAAIITIVGWIPILLFLPSDETDVYRVGGKLYTPNGEFYKSATKHNFAVRKSEHMTEKVDGLWGTTTYVGPKTWSLAIISIPTIIGFFLILMFFPIDDRDVYLANGNLYCAEGFFFKTATKHNFKLRKSQHLQA